MDKKKNHLRKHETRPKSIALHDLSATLCVSPDEITMIMAKDNVTQIMLDNMALVNDNRKFDYFRTLLEENESFVGLNAQLIINLSHIERIEKDTSTLIFLKQHQEAIKILLCYYRPLMKSLMYFYQKNLVIA